MQDVILEFLEILLLTLESLEFFRTHVDVLSEILFREKAPGLLCCCRRDGRLTFPMRCPGYRWRS